MKITVGYIPYLNMAPFHQGFGPEPLEAQGVTIEFRKLSPRALGMEAEAGRIQAGAMSLVDFFRLSDRMEPLGRFGVGVRRESGSVLLFSKRPPAEFEGLCAVTDETSTSLRLLQVLLEKKHNRHSWSYGRVASSLLYDGSADGLLLIGNEALRAKKEGIKGLPWITDLATEWFEWQGFPFVFARWAVDKKLSEIMKELLSRYLESSLESKYLDNIQSKESVSYLRGFEYRLTREHERSMAEFKKLAESLCLTV